MEALPLLLLLLLHLFLHQQQESKQRDRFRLWQSTESLTILKDSVYIHAATDLSPQPLTEKLTDFCIEVAVYSGAYACDMDC